MVVPLPAPLPIAALDLRPNTVVGVARSPFTGASQIYRWPGQWWEATLTLPPMGEAQARLWSAFFTSMNGPEVAFPLPLSSSLRNTGIVGAVAHGWKVAPGAVAGSAWLPVQSTGQGYGVPHVGDYLYISSSSGSFLHQVVNGVQSDGEGRATGMNVWPRLRGNFVGHSFAFVAQGTFRLKAAPTYSYGPSRLMEGLTLELIEAAGM